mmetsp:Transcript_13323/g.36820  ORF Transcript_13323/g.36820 Transcript_13323/m.36820 type:complete len:189 (-) Transcript_13323:517-1083(-)|eukprot:CAMPEP_0198126354 /NCGR_PEP_ID=MMETSP1442-20131203/44610_1 /TAXON_ID= /ORGANISM="Craspedostauros australis, Strain CCMP3328" /LENGTH=188 /DNA_ID=CAMNT_0043786121 /DNA_START=96 /DNA_END=662 /DNA_ORIENTATION=+
MKIGINISLAMMAVASPSVTAFQPSTKATVATTSNTQLMATSDRRVFLESIGAAAAFLTPLAANAEPRPMYLTEPTDEFKANEAKAMEFKRQQLMVKREFAAALEKLTAEPNNAEALVDDLKMLKALVAKTGGLPLGIKKDDMVKIIRSKKAKGFWPTEVEVAYQSLIAEIAFQQSPNMDKEFGNPYQ